MRMHRYDNKAIFRFGAFTFILSLVIQAVIVPVYLSFLWWIDLLIGLITIVAFVYALILLINKRNQQNQHQFRL